jgi:uncharacterized protein (TIGR02284 family)
MLPLNVTSTRIEEMTLHDQKNVQALLEHLATTALDAARGYDLAALRTRDRDLRIVLEGLAAERRGHAISLSTMLHENRREAVTHGTTLASLHRALIELRAKLNHGNGATIISECERGERVALERYELGLRERLPQEVADLLLDQATEIRDTRTALSRMSVGW